MRIIPALVTAALMGGVAGAEAQRTGRHDGFWIGFGVGGGWFNQEGAADEAVGGGAGYLRLGGTPSPKILLGGEGSGWAQVDGDITHSRSNTTFTLYYYPAARGFFAKGGIGAATARVEAQSGNTTVTTTETGLGTTLGVGFDIQVSGNFSITPNFDVLFQRINEVEGSALLMTIGVTWH